MTRWILVTCAMALCGCRPPPPPEIRAAGPVIERLVPDRGSAELSADIQVTIHGSGFAPGGNIVRFGGVVATLVSESDTAIVFWVPRMVPSTGEVPPMVISPGQYHVTVETPAGVSRPVLFRLGVP